MTVLGTYINNISIIVENADLFHTNDSSQWLTVLQRAVIRRLIFAK